ncbi:MAG: hypothetical protein JXA60_06035 [Candidatus Coatesbacteria bacterium]|nr:hypothetical protein [Candidatus Coatesbacteria bacterium]
MTNKTQLPGLLIAIWGGIGVLFAAIALVLSLAGTGLGMLGNIAGQGSPADMIGMGGSMVFSIIYYGLYILWNGVILYGGLQMKQCKNIGLSWAAVIMSAIPCGYCCIIGLPLGIWGIITLLDEEVKAAFASNI